MERRGSTIAITPPHIRSSSLSSNRSVAVSRCIRFHATPHRWRNLFSPKRMMNSVLNSYSTLYRRCLDWLLSQSYCKMISRRIMMDRPSRNSPISHTYVCGASMIHSRCRRFDPFLTYDDRFEHGERWTTSCDQARLIRCIARRQFICRRSIFVTLLNLSLHFCLFHL